MIPTTPTDAMYRLLIQSITDYAIYLLSPDGTVSNWNPGAERAKGYRADEVVGTHFSRFYTPEDRAQGLPARALHTALTEGKFEGHGWRVRKDGSHFWAHVIIDPVFDEQRVHIGFAKITRDRTQFKKEVDQQVREIHDLKENLDLALTNMSEGLCLYSATEQIVLCNDRYSQLLSLPPGAANPGTHYRDILMHRHAHLGKPELIAEAVEQDLRIFHANLGGPGEIFSAERVWAGRTISLNWRRLADGGWVTTAEDITDRKRIEREIVHLAHHDALTTLPNRAAFHEHLERRLATGIPCALLYLDLDRFKPINDSLGHAAGDSVLQTTAHRLGSVLRKHDLGARLGGDEFAILLDDCDNPRDAERVADRLLRDLQKPIHLGVSEVAVGVSIGIALSPLHGSSADALCRAADLALYTAKDAGRACHRTYHEAMQATVQQRRDLERDLRLALGRNEFSLHYQPVLDIERDTVTSFEALLRWDCATRGKVSPADFIPFAEEIGLMPEIGDWVLRTACRQAVTWESDVCVSVNLSATQFRQADLVARVLSALDESGLPPHRLELEITETSMIGDVPGARTVLNQLRDRGIQIAMDDFGTGYSSLSFLRSLPFTRIKIDRSFVQDLGSKPEAVAIIRAVTSLCNGLGVAATAEGVETPEQMQILREEGCSEIQGYLIRRPTSAPEATAWLASYNTATSQLPLIA